MGSKKAPIEPIMRLIVVGIPIEKTSLMFPLFGFRSCFVILKFLGTKKNRIKIEVSSLMTFVKTMKATAYSKPNFKKIGIPMMMAINLTKSSVTFDRTCGNIFCFPKKYPLKILEILINGSTKPMHIKAKRHLSSFNKLWAIKLADKNNKMIIIMFKVKDIGMTEKTKFLLFALNGMF